ncbi:ABC transporter family substrate-binding protein [Arthrobacter russicus]|uniref:Peptide/nickel transport system substrate-binding protein n=1 Tax=Arthrobacter russicus TaxID=172040 RepID=A0ABU1JBJ1_9MICC|nr:ABC transporter family substrate-binding protein [Arthrobacter russicus]MDN5669408.1 ABC transporter family substrate-binding protein [Renibacterium salmoninarum]MDR6268772.1 peptide/nickel transport system substrate-binding protein [Arthrobacter russicus]
MRFGRISKAVSVAAVAALALSACAGNSGNTGSSASGGAAKDGGSATVVEVNGFTSFNADTAQNNVDTNGKIAYATHSGFGYIDDKLNVVRNEKFGKIEKLSDDPLTVKYTVNEGVKWSDGAPVDANDLVLQWASGSAYYDDANSEAKTGTTYFQPAADTSGLNLTSFPEIGDNGRSMTIKYSKPFSDWEVAIGIPNIRIPAHIVAQKAGLKDAAALTDLMKGLPKGDPTKPAAVNESLKKAADIWNTGFDTKQLPTDTSLFLSNGPYIVKDIQPDQSMTLVKNKDYTWGPAAKLDQITVRYIGSASAQIQALKNGEADIIAPQASADTVQQLEALASQGVTMDKADQLSYDHLDLNYNGPFADKNVREAFMKTVPRNDIVNKIIKPLDPEAKPLDSQLFVPAQPKYADTVKNNGSANFQNVDIDGAKQLLNGATPTIRIMYNKDNPNRLNAFTLISQSATQAGFKIVDGGLGGSEWSKALGNGSYDATIFGWINSGVGVSNVPQLFKTGAGNNFNQFSNPEADKLMDELVTTTDKAKQDDLQVQIDKLIWDSAYGLPLFQTIGVDAYSDKVTGIKYNPTQTGVWWNVWDWAAK